VQKGIDVPYSPIYHFAMFHKFWTLGRPHFEVESLEELKIEEKFKWAMTHVLAGRSHYDRAHPFTTVRGHSTGYHQ
jgi:hypothetical protein